MMPVYVCTTYSSILPFTQKNTFTQVKNDCSFSLKFLKLAFKYNPLNAEKLLKFDVYDFLRTYMIYHENIYF